MIYLIISTICFSLSFGIIKSQLTSLPCELVTFSRLLIAGILFIPFADISNIREQVKSGLIGIIQFGLMYLCFINAFKYLQGNEIAILTTSTPIFVLIWSTILGERFRWIYLFSILLSVIGGIIILIDTTEYDMLLKGILLMESSNCCFALGQVLWKKHIKSDSIKNIASAYLTAGISILPILILNNNFTPLNQAQLLSILYLGIIPTGIGFWLWNKGSKSVSHATLAIMNNLKIPIAVLFAITIFKEQINVTNFIFGTSIMLLALIILRKKV